MEKLQLKHDYLRIGKHADPNCSCGSYIDAKVHTRASNLNCSWKSFFEKLEYKFNFIPGSGYWLGTYKIEHIKDAF